MTGTRLEVNVHVITCASTAAQNTVTCVNRAGLEVIDTVLTQLSAAEACLTPDEKELGVALVDIGGGTTDLAIFEKGSLWHTAVLQVGGEHFTNDVAVALRTAGERGGEDQEEARMRADLDGPGGGLDRGPERRRPQAADHGPPGPGRRGPGARGRDLPDGADGDPPRGVRPQPEQRGGAHRRAAAILEGMPEIAEQIFDMPVRRGTPSGDRGAGGRGGEPGLLDRGRPRALGPPQPRAPQPGLACARRRRGRSAR